MHRTATVFVALYALAVAYLSLFPGDFLSQPRHGGLLSYPITGRRMILDVVLNTLFYVPLGWACVLALPRRLSPAVRCSIAIALGMALSYSIESLQLYTPRRVASWSDFGANTWGTAIGAFAGLSAASWRLLTFAHRRRLTGEGVLFLTLWVLWQLFPMIPSIAMARFSLLWNQIAHPEWPPLLMAETAIAFLTLAWVVHERLWLALAFAALIVQGFLMDRELSLAALLAAAAAWIVATAIPRPNPKWVAWMLVAWLVFEEFRPFRTGAHNPFAWAPFESWYASANFSYYYPIIFRKLFLYASVVWWLRASGRGMVVSIAIPASILALGEWAQIYLPGRTPETTDLVTLAAGAVLVALVKKAPCPHQRP